MGFRYNKPRSGIRKPSSTRRRQMLDMRRQKYFRFDLDDLLVEFKIGENTNTVAATVFNKMSSHSMDDAFDYVNRITSAGTLTEEKADRLKGLLQRYSMMR